MSESAIRSARANYRRESFVVLEDFMPVARLLDKTRQLEADCDLPFIERPMPGRGLRYKVMDGHFVHAHMPELIALGDEIGDLLKALDPRKLCSLRNRAAAININITQPGGEYRWHFDRNAVTAILYLNEVEGGSTELVPNARRHLGPFKTTALQRLLDERQVRKILAKRANTIEAIEPRPGRLLIMRGDRCLHSVPPVTGDGSRYNVIFTYDKQGAGFAIEKNLDPYLYSTRAGHNGDPNYVA